MDNTFQICIDREFLDWGKLTLGAALLVPTDQGFKLSRIVRIESAENGAQIGVHIEICGHVLEFRPGWRSALAEWQTKYRLKS